MNPTATTRLTLYDNVALDAVLDRMAAEAAALLYGLDKVAVIGLLRRGAPLADRITARLVSVSGLPPRLRLDLRVKRYADDLTLLFPDTQLTEQPEQAMPDLAGYTLLIVDDVLYQGYSLLRVVEYLRQRQPAAIRVAVLADRCVAALPVQADVVGVRLQLPTAGIIECHVPPYEPDFRIDLVLPAPNT